VSVRLSRRPLSYAAAARELTGPGLGGVVLFAGSVRGEATGRSRVIALDYEVHQGPALGLMKEIDRTARRQFGVERTVLWHRVGRVAAGEVAVIAGAAAAHRAPAFAAAQYLIDQLKKSVPIWKTERARSGRPPRRRRTPRGGRRSG
jgi:molybdopterin synthase catalytic subunit